MRASPVLENRGHQIALLAVFAALAMALSARALEPPPDGAMDAYRRAGILPGLTARAAMYGNHLVKPALAQRTLARLDALTAPDLPHVMAPLTNWKGMPTTGTNRILVFLIDFPDAPSITSYSTITNLLFGMNPSVESLKRFYWRSSYGKLLIEGTALGWHRMAHERNWYTNTYGDGNLCNYRIVQEVATHYDALIDYSQFDNDGDGRIDYFAVIWSGTRGPWSSFWWGYQWSLYSANLTLDGKRFYDFSWQWESSSYPGGSFSPQVIIHETGHGLGVPDYYDYDNSIGPTGGVGRLDQMDGNWGDHNAFSKFMLDWLTPVVAVTNLYGCTLRATAQYPDAAIIMPGYDGSTPYREFFVVQNRHRTLNDSGYPSDGMLIWHVDARPNVSGTDFAWNNSYSSHKLLRLMEADGLEQIEVGYQANAGDYYNQGETFGPYTSPNSRDYSGADTMVQVSGISPNGSTMTADIVTLPEPGVAMAVVLVFGAWRGGREFMVHSS